MAKAKKKDEVKHANPEKAAVARYRRTLSKEKDAEFIKLLESILLLRNEGMKATNIATAMDIGPQVIYLNTCAIPAWVLARELLELIFAARSLGMSVAEYILLLHSAYGVSYVRKHGSPALVQRMYAVAAGDDPE